MSQLVKSAEIWRQNYNPMIGLAMTKARCLLEAGVRGEFADLQWTYRFIEERYATLFGLIERHSSALLELDWKIKTVQKLPKGATQAMADAQAAHLRECYDRIDNLRQAFDFLVLAKFRGFSHLQKHYDDEGKVKHFEQLDQWCWVRQGLYGPWYYNQEAQNVGYRSLPGKEIDESEFLIRTVDRPVGPIALFAAIASGMGKKDWTGFIEIFGIPGGVVIGPPNVPTEKEGEYQSAGETIAKGGSGYLPHGSDFKFNDSPRGVNPFRDFLRYQSEDVVLAGTGGLLTMLAEAGSGTLAGNAHQETFAKIAKAEAGKISEVFQKQFDQAELETKFPGEPRLAYFELSANEETDTGEVVKDIVSLSGAGYETDPSEVSEKTGYTVTKRETQAPGLKPQDLDRQIRNRLVTRHTPLVTELIGNALPILNSARATDLQPFTDRMQGIRELFDAGQDEAALVAWRKLQADLPELLKAINAAPRAAGVLADTQVAALFNGMAESVVGR
jgi:phage gp29-like protein